MKTVSIVYKDGHNELWEKVTDVQFSDGFFSIELMDQTLFISADVVRSLMVHEASK